MKLGKVGKDGNVDTLVIMKHYIHSIVYTEHYQVYHPCHLFRYNCAAGAQ